MPAALSAPQHRGRCRASRPTSSPFSPEHEPMWRSNLGDQRVRHAPDAPDTQQPASGQTSAPQSEGSRAARAYNEALVPLAANRWSVLGSASNAGFRRSAMPLPTRIAGGNGRQRNACSSSPVRTAGGAALVSRSRGRQVGQKLVGGEAPPPEPVRGRATRLRCEARTGLAVARSRARQGECRKRVARPRSGPRRGGRRPREAPRGLDTKCLTAGETAAIGGSFVKASTARSAATQCAQADDLRGVGRSLAYRCEHR